ncbi:MAG TPA: hypothetical protein VKZ53_29110 [Candidatus Angelobacter sp.]|nr:hypothetical protein [Candidatus Angelobacter sp.]
MRKLWTPLLDRRGVGGGNPALVLDDCPKPEEKFLPGNMVLKGLMKTRPWGYQGLLLGPLAGLLTHKPVNRLSRLY